MEDKNIIEIIGTLYDNSMQHRVAFADLIYDKTLGLNQSEINRTKSSVSIDSELSDSSTNPVQNKVVKNAIDNKVSFNALLDYASKDYVLSAINNIEQREEKLKGYFNSESQLNELVPNPTVGDWAVVWDNINEELKIASCELDDIWIVTSLTIDVAVPDLTGYITSNEASVTYQEKLRSGVNIKTINGESILGDGNIQIQQQQQEIDLSNYYTKDQTYNREQLYNKNLTYNKEEIDNRISTISKFTISVVQQLPTEDINETTIYLIQNTGDDYYTQYIYNNNTWVSLGTSRIDLSDYYTKDQTYSKNEIYNKTEVQSLLEDYEQSHDVNPDHHSETCDCPTFKFLTQSEYDELSSYDEDTVYFIIELSTTTRWKFGDKFPVRFSNQWLFGDKFPIILT